MADVIDLKRGAKTAASKARVSKLAAATIARLKAVADEVDALEAKRELARQMSDLRYQMRNFAALAISQGETDWAARALAAEAAAVADLFRDAPVVDNDPRQR